MTVSECSATVGFSCAAAEASERSKPQTTSNFASGLTVAMVLLLRVANNTRGAAGSAARAGEPPAPRLTILLGALNHCVGRVKHDLPALTGPGQGSTISGSGRVRVLISSTFVQ